MTSPFPPNVAAQQSNRTDPPIFTLGDLLEIVRRHARIALVAAAAVATLVIVAGIGRTPMYEAQARITLDRTPQPTEKSDSPVDVRIGLYENSLLNTQRNILLSTNVLQAALRSPAFLTNDGYINSINPIDRLQERFSVSTSRDSWDLSLSFRDENNDRAEAGLIALIEAYQNRHLREAKEKANDAITFLEQQVSEADRKMIEARERQQAFQRTNGLVVLEAERSLPAQRLQSLNSRKIVLAQQIAALDILAGQINTIDAIPDREERLSRYLTLDLVNRHPTVVEQVKLLYQLQTELSLIQEKYLEKHPRLIELRSQLATKKQHVVDAIDAIRSGVLADSEKLNGQMKGLLQEIDSAEIDFNTYRENLFTLQTYIIQTKAAEEQYAVLLKRLNEERVQQRLAMQQLSITDSPRARTRPVNISYSLTVALALVLAGVTMVAVPLLVSFFGRRARDPGEIRTLIGAPVIAELPHVSGLQPLGANGNPDATPKLTEAFRGLRTALQLTQKNGGGAADILLVTSCDNAEGKSSTSARLAVSLAMSGLRVLLIDGDLRHPSIGEQLGQVCDRGLSQLLAGEPGIAPAKTTYANLDLMDAGVAVPNPGELLGSHCLPEWLAHCREAYDYIIIDSPPMRWFADALMLGTHADRILFIVREGITQRSSLAKVREQLSPLASKPLDVIVINTQQHGRIPFYGDASYGQRTGSHSAA